MFERADALALAQAFDPTGDGLAAKSQELVVNLLRHTAEPFSRHQFLPGHITCTALILSPDRQRALLMFHHRHQRWLLPGGHVEEVDQSLADTARREAHEETGVLLHPSAGVLTGMDVHAIPAKKDEPYHLHHDLVFALQAAGEQFTCSEEAPQVEWCRLGELLRYRVPPNIISSTERALRELNIVGTNPR